MPATLPDGDPVPHDGALPAAAVDDLGRRGFGIYVHVPFCTVRCGYCDFNTYTADELGSAHGASRSSYADAAIAELELARRVLADVDCPVSTVFVGGGTPTLLPAADLGRILDAVRRLFPVATDAEVTTEANPESLDTEYLTALRERGFTRLSLGMQSVVPHVLAVLDRQHTPGRARWCVDQARSVGFEHISLDLIYGTPGESERDWQASLEAAIAAGVDHVSAYSLIVEQGTRLATRVRRGELTVADDDVLAERYLQADESLRQAGYDWYEVSNWAHDPSGRCRHNLLYWRDGDWWGVGPGAHSHVSGVRWWNVKHPAVYAQRLVDRLSPAHAREVLGPASRRMERVMLELRTRDGLPLDLLDTDGRRSAAHAATDGLLDAAALETGQAVLTRRGRLLADGVVRSLLP